MTEFVEIVPSSEARAWGTVQDTADHFAVDAAMYCCGALAWIWESWASPDWTGRLCLRSVVAVERSVEDALATAIGEP